MPSDVRDSLERGWRELAAIDEAFERGEIDEQGWHDAVAAIVVPSYLAGETPWEQSGKSGDLASWELGRRPVMAAVDRDGAFLDVGCANGYLMESVRAWGHEDGRDIEPYGLDISPELAELARRRLPQWADRIFTGNAANWLPPRRFDFVRTGLDYVPPTRRRDLVEHLLVNVVAPRGRLIVGVFNEEKDERRTEQRVESWGFRVAGRRDVDHRDPRVAYRVFWIDAEE
jgi:2-polyprenyl-3-methyl-5-hydroxy-6-metoxy-1,4-benzoquinol methylase